MTFLDILLCPWHSYFDYFLISVNCYDQSNEPTWTLFLSGGQLLRRLVLLFHGLDFCRGDTNTCTKISAMLNHILWANSCLDQKHAENRPIFIFCFGVFFCIFCPEQLFLPKTCFVIAHIFTCIYVGHQKSISPPKT